MYKTILIVITYVALGAQWVWASPTGLNNIPTTDVAPDRTLVLQSWLNTGKGAGPSYFTGFKYGVIDRMELGLDSKVGSDDEGPVSLQSKLKVIDFDFGLSSLIGVEGITFGDIDDNLVPYAVGTQDLKFFRLHSGYGFQKDNFGVFLGLDKTIKLLSQDLILRSDIKQVKDGKELLVSAGFLLTLPFNLAIETWITTPTEGEKEESVTVKIDYAIKF